MSPRNSALFISQLDPLVNLIAFGLDVLRAVGHPTSTELRILWTIVFTEMGD